jgi:peptide-methionine (R)-S-oxide reductase
VLTGIDGNPYTGGEPDDSLVEVHCRRCGGHLGHLVSLDNRVVHCINGTSLERRAPAA